MTNIFEIYFHNLSEQTKKDYLEFQGVTSPEELNTDIAPIAIVEKQNDSNTPL